MKLYVKDIIRKGARSAHVPHRPLVPGLNYAARQLSLVPARTFKTGAYQPTNIWDRLSSDFKRDNTIHPNPVTAVEALQKEREKWEKKWVSDAHDSPELALAKKRAKEEFELVAKGHMLSLSASPLRANAPASDVENYLKRGFNLGVDLKPDDLAHLAVIFFNKLTNEMDVATGYRFATQPYNFTGVPGKNDSLDFNSNRKLSQAGVIERDIAYAFDPQKRLDHQAQVIPIHFLGLDTLALAETVAIFRHITHLQIEGEKNGYAPESWTGEHQKLPLHRTQKFPEILPEPYHGRQITSCQEITCVLFSTAFPGKILPVPNEMIQTTIHNQDESKWVAFNGVMFHENELGKHVEYIIDEVKKEVVSQSAHPPKRVEPEVIPPPEKYTSDLDVLYNDMPQRNRPVLSKPTVQEALEPHLQRLEQTCTLGFTDSDELRDAKQRALLAFDAIKQGDVLCMASSVLYVNASKEQIQQYRMKGLNTAEDANLTKPAHLSLVFLNPLTNDIDVITSVRFPVSPSKPYGFVGIASNTAIPLAHTSLRQPSIVEQDIANLLDPHKRIEHQVETTLLIGLDRLRLAKAVAVGRSHTKKLLELEQNGGISGIPPQYRLPLHANQDLSNLPPEYKDRRITSSQGRTVEIFKMAFPGAGLAVPKTLHQTTIKNIDGKDWFTGNLLCFYGNVNHDDLYPELTRRTNFLMAAHQINEASGRRITSIKMIEYGTNRILASVGDGAGHQR